MLHAVTDYQAGVTNYDVPHLIHKYLCLSHYSDSNSTLYNNKERNSRKKSEVKTRVVWEWLFNLLVLFGKGFSTC